MEKITLEAWIVHKLCVWMHSPKLKTHRYWWNGKNKFRVLVDYHKVFVWMRPEKKTCTNIDEMEKMNLEVWIDRKFCVVMPSLKEKMRQYWWSGKKESERCGNFGFVINFLFWCAFMRKGCTNIDEVDKINLET